VRRCVDQGRTITDPDAGRNTGRRLDLEMRDLEARQARSHVPALAIVVAPEDAEVRGDVQIFICIVANDVIYRQVAVICWCREGRCAALHVKVREQAGSRGRRTTLQHVEDVAWKSRRRGVVAGVGDPGVVHVARIRIDRAREPRRRVRVVDPMPRDAHWISRIGGVRHENTTRRGRGPQCLMVGLIPREPGDRPSHAIDAVGSAGQVAVCVQARPTTQRLEVAATRLASKRGELGAVRLVISNVGRRVLRNCGGIRARSESP